MSKPLSQVQTARLNTLVNRMLEQAERDKDLMEASVQSTRLATQEEGLALLKLSDRELDMKGWSRAALIVAIHAVAPRGQVPAYLQWAHERESLRIRARENGGSTDTPKAKGYVLPAPSQRQEGGGTARLTPAEDDE